MSDSRQHLNSLGYVIGGKQGRALIVWGYDAEGRRVGIEEAERGGAQGLRCECTTPLVAKKGDIREHHYAHCAGQVRHCEVAAAGALSKFIGDIILDAGRLRLPTTAGLTGYAEVHGVTPLEVGPSLIHVVDAQRDRKLAVFARLKRVNLEGLSSWCTANQVSGMAIDLAEFRNRTDDEIRHAVAELARRDWLFRNPHHDDQASPAFLRRLFGLGGIHRWRS